MRDQILALLNNNPSWVGQFRFTETKFSEGDVDDFLAGHTSNHSDDGYDYATDRPLHIRQAISYIGSTIDEADATYTNYKAVWRLTTVTNCGYCSQEYSVRLMMLPLRKACCGSTWCAKAEFSEIMS